MARIDGSPGAGEASTDQGSLAAASIAALSVLMLFVLYLLRKYDDNALVSWRWVFGHLDANGLFITLALGAVVAYMVSTLGLPGPRGQFILAAVLGAFFLPVPEVIIDSSRYFTQSKHLGQFGIVYFIEEWGRGIEAWTDLPLMPFIYGLGFRFIGEYRIVVQLTVLLMFAGAVSLTSLLGRDIFGHRAGGLSGMFLLSMPYLYTQVPLMMVDVPSMFFLVLAVFSLRRGLLIGGLWALVWAPLALAMALLTKYSLWPMLSVTLPVFTLAFMEDKGAFRRCLLIVLVFSAITLPVLWYYRDVMGPQMDLLFSYQRPGLEKWSESLFSTFFFNVHPFVTLAAVASVILAIRRLERWYIPLIWLIVLILLVLGVKRIRYTIPVFPMLSLMAAYAVSMIRHDRAVRSFAYASLIASFVLAFAAYAPFLQSNSLVNLKLAGQYLDVSGIKSARVRTLPQRSIINPAVSVPILDLYTQAKIVYEYGLLSTRSPDELLSSSYRFTWTYRNPEYYRANDANESADSLVLVTLQTERLNDTELLDMELLEKYDIHEGLFKFRPMTLIYRPYIDK